MAVTLVGEVANNCDSTTGFTGGTGFGTDDAAWEGTAAYGTKASATTVEFYTTSLSAAAPYDFSSGGTEAGWHMILWSNTKTPVNATTGLTIIVGNGTSRGRWNVIGDDPYTGGWQTRVVDMARDFDLIAAGSWTLAGNPAQLTAISQAGGGFTTTTSIMGSFNNVQIDQFTLGLGLRVDGGSVGAPNTFDTVKVADQDGTLWGWWSQSNGAYLGKGGLYIGPSTGSATSVFNDSAFSVNFAKELVGSGFYQINSRGAGTDVTFNLANISSADVELLPFSRWSLTNQSDLNSFLDTNGTWQKSDILTLHGASTCSGTTMIDCRRLVQNSGLLDSCTIIGPDRGDGQSFIYSDYPHRIERCDFIQSSGHAIELSPLASGKTITFVGNSFTGFEGTAGTNATPNSGPTNAAVFNNSSGNITLNITGGGTSPIIRNGLGATTTVVATLTLTLSDIVANSEVRVYTAGTTTELDGIESSSTSFGFDFENGDPNVDIRIFHIDYLPVKLSNFTLPTVDASIPIQQIFDRNYTNPPN